MKRVVVTGRGVISPMGRTLSDLMDGLEQKRSAVRFMPGWDNYQGLNSRVAAPAELMDIKEIPRKVRRSMGRLSFFCAEAAGQAAADAGLDQSLLSSGEIGCIMGSTMGGAEALHDTFEIMLPDHNLAELSSMNFFKCVSHTAAMNTAQYLGITGYVMATSAACASSLQALGLGFELIRSGRQTGILCGGAEEIHPIVTGIFDILFATSTKHNDSPEQTPRPFDARRDGLVCGEGAGVLCLEEREHAAARGAKILGEVVGYATCGSGDHVSQSSRENMARCMRSALRDAGLKPADIDYISAHATATLQGDQAEAEAIADVFGSEVPVSSLKGYIGHTLGASGAIELAAALEMTRRQVLYPTLNLEEVDPACAGIRHVRGQEEKKLKYILKNCFAFGGINASLICRSPEN